MGASNEYEEDAGDREIVSTRLLLARREHVFRAWTDMGLLAQWWGPKGFTNTFREFDMRPGGLWYFVMHGPNRIDYQNISVFVEVVKPEKIVYDHVSIPRYRAIASFAEEEGHARLTFRMVFPSAAECSKVKTYTLKSNEEAFDRLEAQLAKIESWVGP